MFCILGGTRFSLVVKTKNMYDPKDKKPAPRPEDVPQDEQKELNKSAFDEAYQDIESDPEFTEGNENDDLDEEESRELGDPGLGF
jgi:hypothetical protein